MEGGGFIFLQEQGINTHSMPPLMYMESLLSSSSSSTSSLQHLGALDYQMVIDPLLEVPFMAQASDFPGIERELFVPLPQLENTTSGYIEENVMIENTCDDSNTSSDNLSNVYNIDSVGAPENTNNSANMEEVKIGEWDLEELLKDVSNFPFIDFQ